MRFGKPICGEANREKKTVVSNGALSRCLFLRNIGEKGIFILGGVYK